MCFLDIGGLYLDWTGGNDGGISTIEKKWSKRDGYIPVATGSLMFSIWKTSDNYFGHVIKYHHHV